MAEIVEWLREPFTRHPSRSLDAPRRSLKPRAVHSGMMARDAPVGDSPLVHFDAVPTSNPVNPMKTHLTLLRTAFAISTLGVVSFASGASTPETRSDVAAQHLAQHGAVSITRAGPFVAPGTYRVQVSTKFGRPDAILADGTWMYHHRRVEGSDAEGTLVVRFEQNRVISLTLVTPAVATAMRTPSPKHPGNELVARN